MTETTLQRQEKASLQRAVRHSRHTKHPCWMLVGNKAQNPLHVTLLRPHGQPQALTGASWAAQVLGDHWGPDGEFAHRPSRAAVHPPLLPTPLTAYGRKRFVTEQKNFLASICARGMAACGQDEVSPKRDHNEDYSPPVRSSGTLSSKTLEVTGWFSNALAAVGRVRALLRVVGAAEDVRACHQGWAPGWNRLHPERRALDATRNPMRFGRLAHAKWKATVRVKLCLRCTFCQDSENHLMDLDRPKECF